MLGAKIWPQGLEVEGSLNLTQLIELGLGAVAVCVCGRVGNVLFGILDQLGKLAGIKLEEIEGCLGKNGQAGRTNFGKTAADEEALMLAAGQADVEQAGSKR